MNEPTVMLNITYEPTVTPNMAHKEIFRMSKRDGEALNDDHLDPRETRPSLGLVNQQLLRSLKIGC